MTVFQGYTDGMESKKEDIAEKSREIGQESLDNLQEVLDEHSPSKETQKMGEYFVQGFGEGIEQEKQALIDTVSNMATSVLQTVELGLPKSVAVEIGKKIPTGIAEGIRAGQYQAIQAAAEMAKKTLAAAEEELNVNGTSEYFGEMSKRSCIDGWRESIANVNAIVVESLPDTSMKLTDGTLAGKDKNNSKVSKTYNIEQYINICEQTDDLIETARKFKESQKEAAEEW